jgi:hypothetical protein
VSHYVTLLITLLHITRYSWHITEELKVSFACVL